MKLICVSFSSTSFDSNIITTSNNDNTSINSDKRLDYRNSSSNYSQLEESTMLNNGCQRFCRQKNNYLLPYSFWIIKHFLYIKLLQLPKKFQQNILSTVPSINIFSMLQCYVLFTILSLAQQLNIVMARDVIIYDTELVTKSPQSAIEEMNPILR